MEESSWKTRSVVGPRRRIRHVLIGLAGCGAAITSMMAAETSSRLWYTQPAQFWTEALPVGNGRFGAMVFGGVAEEHLQFNEDTLWQGTVHQYQHDGAVEVLPELRRLLFAGKQKEAEALAMERFMSAPMRQCAYQAFGDLWLTFPGHDQAEDYRRELDLDTAVQTVRYRIGGVGYTREVFSSFPDQVLVQRLSADQKGKIGFALRLESPHAERAVSAIAPNELMLTGCVQADGLRFAARVRVSVEGGTVQADGATLVVTGADAATIVLAANTSFVSFEDISGDPQASSAATLSAVRGKSFPDLLRAHVADHQALFRRVSIDLGETPADVSARPTDERLARADKTDDPDLVELLFNFGRYLLIASSRPGDQPANLQGIWNDLNDPPWGSKYTTNINLEMNYWPAEMANLPECAVPLFDMIDDLMVSGRRTAQAHYGARGWVLHHNTDLWRGTAPINHANHGIWSTGAAWLCLSLWEHWRFSGDRAFLAGRAYPAMKAAAEFFVDTLVEDPRTGRLVNGPSNSPEQGGLVMGPTMDHQLIRGLFTWTAEAARELDVDAGFAAQLDALRARIAPNQIGRHGQLQEWLVDVDDPENKHRHVSHLWGVYPGEDITWATPELMRAARQSLVFRGDGGTGWSLGWKVSLWARFLDGDHAHRILMNQLNAVRDTPNGSRNRGPGGTYPNMFDAHPPFQIDGNFAATAGICEMLVQSHRSEIHVLPALPSAWGTGSVTGLRARGGFEVDLTWKDGTLARLVLHSRLGGTTRVRCGDRVVDVEVAPGGAVTLGRSLEVVRAPTSVSRNVHVAQRTGSSREPVMAVSALSFQK